MKHPARPFLCLILLIMACALSAAGQAADPDRQAGRITVEWLYSQEAREIGALPSVSWLDDGSAMIFNPRAAGEKRTIFRLNPESGLQTTALDAKRAIESLGKLIGDEKAGKNIRWPAAFGPGGRLALYIIEDDIFLLDLPAAEFKRVTQTQAPEAQARFSPDGRKLAFVRDNNIFVYDIEAKTERRLTEDGSEARLNGALSWVYWEEIFGRNEIGYWWSGDSQAIAFLQSDESPVSFSYFVDFKPDVPRLIRQRYPQAGGPNPVVKAGIVEIADGKITWADFGKNPCEYIVRIKWLPGSRRLAVETLNRAQDELDVYFVDRTSGRPEHILKETDEGWVNIHEDLYFLNNGRHFIWASARDGYTHLYRFSMDGKLVNQITKGNWSTQSSGGTVFWLRKAVEAIDEKGGRVYFTALEKSSIERHLYRIKLDGTAMERLTGEEGTHAVSFSPDAKFYFDRYSNRSTPPALALYKNDGRLARGIAPPSLGRLAEFGVPSTTLFTIPAKDGFPMPAELVRPRDFDASRRYPVILSVYGGPSAPIVADAWRGRSLLFDQVLLDRGYLVLQVDNRSATAISKKLENTILKEGFGTQELNDLLDAVAWLKKQSYVDPDRIGIWGWSGGGVFTLSAMTRSKEFKAGIAVAAVTDWRYYDTVWTEAFMKRPQDNPEGYEKTSLVRRAKDLHGRLLLVHGTYDDNVHPQNAWAFIDELIKAGKMFDLMMYPMRKHGISDDPAQIHLYNRMVEFWTKNL